jgi:hypothetical protein
MDKKVIPILIDTDRQFVITYIAMLKDELVAENIITKTQSWEIGNYIQKELESYRKKNTKTSKKVTSLNTNANYV